MGSVFNNKRKDKSWKMISLEQCEALLREAPNRLAFLRAWLGWRRREELPALAKVRPEDIGAALPCMLVFEPVAREHVSIRLAGTQFTDLLGREITGENFIDLAPPTQREMRMAHFESYQSHPCGARRSADMVRASGFPISVAGIVLPVAVPDNRVRMYAAFDFSHAAEDLVTNPLSEIPAASEIDFIDIGFGAPV